MCISNCLHLLILCIMLLLDKKKSTSYNNNARLEVSRITSTRGLLLRGYTGRGPRVHFKRETRALHLFSLAVFFIKSCSKRPGEEKK